MFTSPFRKFAGRFEQQGLAEFPMLLSLGSYQSSLDPSHILFVAVYRNQTTSGTDKSVY